MATKVGINGFGRIGRCVARVIAEREQGDIELVGINDLTSPEMLAHLLEWDSVHGHFSHPVKAEDGAIWIGDQRVPVSAERDPAKLNWKDLGAEIVLECTGLFRSREAASAHLQAGAERVIISAPAKGDVDGTFCVGINSDKFDPSKDRIISGASCTTNCLAPLVKVLNDTFGIVKGHMVTVHSYTNDQRILDLPHSDMRRARAAALSMIPTSTGAAKAIGLVLPELKGKLDGTAIRVPTPNVSLTCLTAQVARNTDRDEVNKAFKEAAEGPLRGILAFEERPLVSSDFMGNAHSSILDAAQTQVVGGDLVEVQSWYDNEWGFSNRMVDLVQVASSAG
ncbi:MAG: type I glyceraldehyde-3-phosphate dehydrogenase [Deltaproteobacteria bacterium]|nr:type I glyceraldehyde-3-phosphate dehydrogenase [Deltaproteobacteria bacterium]